MDYIEFTGQIFGIIAVILGFISFQMKSLKKLMTVQVIISLTFVIHYFLIGAKSACVLNLVSAFRSFVYCNRDKKIFKSNLYPVAFAVIMGVSGVFSWQGWYSLFIIIGLTINTLCLAMKEPDNIRKSILITSPMVIVYNIFARSYGGIIFESTVMLSSLVGIIRYKKQIKN